MKLHELPEELLLLIADDDSLHSADRAALVATCRRIYNICQDLVCRNILVPPISGIQWTGNIYNIKNPKILGMRPPLKHNIR